MTVNTDLLMALIVGDVIERAHCRHAHTAIRGKLSFVAGELIDELFEECTDCGQVFDGKESEESDELPF